MNEETKAILSDIVAAMAQMCGTKWAEEMITRINNAQSVTDTPYEGT